MSFNYSGSKKFCRSKGNFIIGCIILVFFLSVSSVKAQVQSQSDEDIIALIGATVIDGTGDESTDNKTILIKGKKITCIGDCKVPQNAQVKDVSGKYIMPGLIDLHVHYSLSGWIDSLPGLFGIDVSDKFPYEDVYSDLKNNPGRFHRSHLCSGVTTVFEPGGFPWGFQIEQKTFNSTNSPRYITAGPILTSLERIIDHPLGDGMSIYMKDEETVQNAIRMLNWKGSSWVKLHRPDLFESKAKRKSLINILREEAQKTDMSVITNTPTLEGAKDGLRTGASLFVYPVEDTLVDKEFLSLAKQNDLVYTPAFEAGAGRKEIQARSFDENRLPLACVDPETREKAFLRIHYLLLPPMLRSYRIKQKKLEISEKRIFAESMKQESGLL